LSNKTILILSKQDVKSPGTMVNLVWAKLKKNFAFLDIIMHNSVGIIIGMFICSTIGKHTSACNKHERVFFT